MSLAGRSIPAAFFCIAVGISASADGQISRRVFLEGTYRQDGTCTKVAWLGKDRTSECEPSLLVVARERDLPQFMFMLGSLRSYVFLASRTAEFLDESGRATRYSVARVVDLESRSEYASEGECTLLTSEGRQEVHCILWRNKSRTEVAVEAHFVGDGVWWQKPRIAP